jgi:hypothetical protein
VRLPVFVYLWLRKRYPFFPLGIDRDGFWFVCYGDEIGWLWPWRRKSGLPWLSICHEAGFRTFPEYLLYIRQVEEVLTGKDPSPVFTPDEVKSLNAYQACGMWHPFTCGNGCGETLLATTAGWICRGGCGYGQDWAHQFMKDWRWKKELEASPMHMALLEARERRTQGPK